VTIKLNSAAIPGITSAFVPKAFKRIFPSAFQTTPLGTGPAAARFSSVVGNFNTLYAAVSLSTAIAEAVIRDRFEGDGPRHLFASELTNRSLAEVSATIPLDLIDLRTDGCFKLGVSTDIASAKGWGDSRNLAQYIHDHTAVDGFLYRSRLTGANCIAVFDRAILAKLTADNVMELIAAPGLAAAISELSVDVIR